MPSAPPAPLRGELAKQLVALHYAPDVTATYLRTFAWWCGWHGRPPLLDDDLLRAGLFLRTLVAAGGTRTDVVATLSMLRIVYSSAPQLTALTATKWSAIAPIRAVYAHDATAALPHCQHPGTRLLLVLLSALGLREREALSLTPQSIDWPRQRLRVGNSGASRWLPLPPGIGPVVARSLAAAGGGPLACSTGGQPLTRPHFRADLSQAGTRVGLAARLTPAAVRHGYGACELRSGRDFRMLLVRLGLPAGNGLVPRLGPNRPSEPSGEAPRLTGNCGPSRRSLGWMHRSDGT